MDLLKAQGDVGREFDDSAAAYLARCQVDTPLPLVQAVWRLVRARRTDVGDVADFGCGDLRFALAGKYRSYTGFEIDPKRARQPPAVQNLRVRIECAFQATDTGGAYDVCVGNPPYVRHHDLDETWVSRATARLQKIDGYRADGRSNAYVYFMWLALDSVRENGLACLVTPYEWVSRPASGELREHIKRQGYDVDVYYLDDAGFERVLTTACITVIDKASRNGAWRLHRISPDGEVSRNSQLTRTNHRRLAYERARTDTYALRGFSPGDQPTFVLTEDQRIENKLVVGRDVVRAVTSFRHLNVSQRSLTATLFRNEFVEKGKRCWLLKPSESPSAALRNYFERVPTWVRKTYTCANRSPWWLYTLAPPADIVYSSGFKTVAPKMMCNDVAAVHVGSIHGIYCTPRSLRADLLTRLRAFQFGRKVVPLSNGFLKVEVNQMNAVLNQLILE